MNVTIEPINRHEIRRQLRMYRNRVHTDAEREYSAVADQLERIEKLDNITGIVDVARAIERGGFDVNNRPRLAMARADRKIVRVEVWPSYLEFDTNANFDVSGWATLKELYRFRTPVPAGNMKSGFARVPLVPPAIRDVNKGRLKDYHILWEVDQWFDRHPDRVSRDPFLLRRINGSVFGVVAQWDLTPLEMAILNSIQEPAR